MENQLKNLQNKVKGSVTLKLISIGIVILILLYPKSAIEDLISERQNMRYTAITDVTSKWGTDQVIVGPIISIPYWQYKEVEKKLIKTKYYAFFLPEELKIDGNLEPESRYRGIHEVIVYQSDLQIQGSFEHPDFDVLNIDPAEIIWEEAQVQFSLSDLRGIKEAIPIILGNERLMFKPGLNCTNVLSRGLSVPLTIDAKNQTSIPFDFDVKINGSTTLSFTPVGSETKISVNSPWQDPSFTGNILPANRNISEAGFTADWSVLNLNRSYPQQWRGAAYSLANSDFGVELFVPANEYQKSTRSAKYAMLILFLTFVTYFFGEILGKRKIHPIQYGIVGLNIIIFYTLLVSISEYLPFNIAYAIAAVFIIGAVSSYSVSIFKSTKRGAYMGGFLVVVYLFIFVILQSQDYSLLIGSIGLFITLVLVMYFSRNVNWYDIKVPSKSNSSTNL